MKKNAVITVGWLYWGLTPLYQLRLYHGGRDAHVFPGFLTPVLHVTQLFFPKPPTAFLTHFSEVRGENTPERKFASIGARTHNHQVMSPTLSPLSNPGGAQ